MATMSCALLPYGLLLLFFPVSTLFLYLLVRRASSPQAKGSLLPLPPGSMGLPYLGETFQLYSQDPNIFFAGKQKRYGEVFKSHFLGNQCIMLASPEAARFVLVTRSDLFKPTYPKSKEALIGPWAVMFHEGAYHANVRRRVLGPLLPGSICRLVSAINDIAASALKTCDGRVVRTFRMMKGYTFEVAILAILGQIGDKRKEELKKNYLTVDRGYNSFLTNMPWTPYSRAIQARRRVGEILEEIVRERRETGATETKDVLGSLLEETSGQEQHLKLSDGQIADNINGVLFAAQDTTASILTWILKYLDDHPKLLQAVKEEQMRIYQSNEKGRKLTWSQTRSMPLTHRVILESMRMASIISFTFREAVEDVEYNGYLIPKGWKVMPLFRNIHHSSQYFKDPENFDPSRFKDPIKPNTFLPFGNGMHSCPGNELAKLQMLVLIHHLATKYRWEVIGSKREMEYGPFFIPKHGLPARFWRV